MSVNGRLNKWTEEVERCEATAFSLFSGEYLR